MDLAIFTTPEAWITMISLIFLEVVLGIDNLVFISITTNRLPVEKQHIGRKLGLGGALVMRIIFLSFASFLVHMTNPLFTLDLGSYSHGFSVRDIVLLLGGAYLIYKGIHEVLDMLRLTEVKAAHSEEHRALHTLGLPQAVGTIMVMDVVFSIDSVITAVGMADHLIIMIIAVMLAVFMMMVFIDPISNFINGHPEMKMLALTFIVAIGCLLVIDAMGFHTGIELLHMPLEKLIVYFAMVFCIVLELIQMRYNANYYAWRKNRWKNQTKEQVKRVREEARGEVESEIAELKAKYDRRSEQSGEERGDALGFDQDPVPFTPIFIGGDAYFLMPMNNEDSESLKSALKESDEARESVNDPIVIDAVDSDRDRDEDGPASAKESEDVQRASIVD